MAFEVVWHALASVDLEDEIEYVFYEFGWEASRKLYIEVMERINHLSQFPKLGVRNDGITFHGDEVRIWNVRQHAIVYAVGEKKITIIVFWDNHRDPSCLERLIGSR